MTWKSNRADPEACSELGIRPHLEPRTPNQAILKKLANSRREWGAFRQRENSSENKADESKPQEPFSTGTKSAKAYSHPRAATDCCS